MSLAARCYVGWNQHWIYYYFKVFCFKTERWISVLAFSPPVFRFYTKSDWESGFFFQNAFRNKEREQKNYGIFRVFLNTLLPAISYATQLDLSFEKHMPCYVHRTQILKLTSAKGKLWGNLQTTSRQLKWRIRRSTSHESLSLPPAETRTKKYIYWGCHFLSNSTG